MNKLSIASNEPLDGTLDLSNLRLLSTEMLRQEALARGLELSGSGSKSEFLRQICRFACQSGQSLSGRGILQIVLPDRFGFLRHADSDFQPCHEDIFVSASQIARLGLRTGQEIRGMVRAPKESERYFALVHVQEVDGTRAEQARSVKDFYSLTPIFPAKRLLLDVPGDFSTRIADLLSPMGKGQRALIVSPPKAGKTMLLQQIARAIAHNHPDAKLMALLVDERPAEVTEFRRTVPAEVFASTFDESPARHCRVAEMVLERAKRLVECGRDVVILLDSITRLARAYNSETDSGKIMTGGLDAAAVQIPKKLFGAARNTEEGGSLTILATALVDTGSRMDDFIYEEFKGTGDCEIHLDRRLASRHVYPAIDPVRSSTRKEELLLHPDEHRRIRLLRKYLQDLNIVEAVEFLIEKMHKTKNNVEFLMGIHA
ncbi:MAG: transcription termination factor Rho [Planctomycetes bacterium]|nr:transcription termination factor Rho [Planctomycetota bacterium]